MATEYTVHNEQLAMIGSKANDIFWDDHWSNQIDQILEAVKIPWYLKGMLGKLKREASIIEIGCGTGHIVKALRDHDFMAEGIDIAYNTIHYLQSLDLPVKLGDARKMNFPDNSFDGAVCLGVIEHFFDETDIQLVLKEAVRVIKPGGYMFFSVPYLNVIRQNLLNEMNNKHIVTKDNFYQRFYSRSNLHTTISNLPIELTDMVFYDPLKGLADEISGLEWIKQKPWSLPFSFLERFTPVMEKYCHMISITARVNK